MKTVWSGFAGAYNGGMRMAVQVQARLISSLEKVFWDEELRAPAWAAGSALRGERFSFQAAFRMEGAENLLCAAAVQTPLAAELWEVGQVPVTHPVMREHDDGYLRTVPGLYPDPLYPHRGAWSLAAGQWRCLWVTVEIPPDAPAGIYPIIIRLSRLDGEVLAEPVFRLQVIPVSLPEQSLLHTEWFHIDCLASHYGVPMFSEEHWRLMDAYMGHAARYGVNLLLTPVFTPPLDTAVGGERPTSQLVDVWRGETGYRFGFERLDRYMNLAESHGIQRFEISHLFTQWGACAAPKIMGMDNGEYRRLFGWDTDASSRGYGEFLNAFLRALKSHLAQAGRLERCWFHISDEPMEKLENYRCARDSVWEELKDCRVIDALSDYTCYEQGLVRQPIPSLDKLDDFLERGFPHPWTYYCSGQSRDVSNRFMAMPSCRNRILGWQLYKYRVEGFLQWGFNFWYSHLSIREVNPYLETGALDAYPAGDAYLVYPGEDGLPLPSIREAVFFEALQDMRALQLLEALAGRDAVHSLLDRGGTLSLRTYPGDPSWILETREEVNRQIAFCLWGEPSGEELGRPVQMAGFHTAER